MEEQRRTAIRNVFYVDQLMLQQGPQMTATEVIQRNEEKMRLLGPVLGRLQSELLKPLIDRVFNILLRNNQLKVLIIQIVICLILVLIISSSLHYVG